MTRRIGIIGHFGAGGNFYDGQTIKTQNLARLLRNTEKLNIVKVDTYYAKTNRIRLLIDTLRCLLSCKHIFLLVADKGMQVYLPLLYYLNKITRCRIYHYIIGSELLQLVDEVPGLVRYLNALTVNWFEYESGTAYLKAKGVTNAETLANFKLITPVESATTYQSEENMFRFCTFSRVMEEKGITEAVEAIREINRRFGRRIVTLDIYGPVEKKYAETFEHLLAENKSAVRYLGVADSGQSVEILKDYYALLFPTHWAGEGVPGTVIDAFASGIPVIASDWNANKEVIQHGKQGILYPDSQNKNLTDAVVWAVTHPESMNEMRKESRAEFEKYTPETIMKVILHQMAEP